MNGLALALVLSALCWLALYAVVSVIVRLAS